MPICPNYGGLPEIIVDLARSRLTGGPGPPMRNRGDIECKKASG